MKTNIPNCLIIWPVKKHRRHMINKIISKLIRTVLLLEIHLRGPRIKYSAWRKKILGSQYIQSHCVYPTHRPRRLMTVLVDTHRKAAYLIIYKAAYTSIGRTFFDNESHRQAHDQWTKEKGLDYRPLSRITKKNMSNFFPLNNIKFIRHSKKSWLIAGIDAQKNFEKKNISLDEVNSYFVFTFVRNPFSRLVSFFNNVYLYQDAKYHLQPHRQSYIFWLHEVSSFSELAYKVSKIPDCHLDRHLLPQHLWIDNFQGKGGKGGKIDFIGKYETLKQDFEPIRKKFNFLYLGHENKSIGEHEDWRDYYTPKTAKMVYQRFRKDFERFGYEDEYPKLLDYLATKQKKA